MDLVAGQYLVCNENMAKKFPTTRTLGKAYKITDIKNKCISVENDRGTTGIFTLESISKYFTIKNYELWI